MASANKRMTKLLHGGVLHGYADCDSVVIEGNRIRSIGNSEQLMPVFAGRDDVQIVDLQGRYLLPGFIDAHIHLLHTGLVESGWRIGLMHQSRAEVLETLRQASRQRAGDWIVSYGWDESNWTDRRYLTRAELDRVSPESPLLAIRMDGHLLAANSLAMKRVPSTAPETLVERESGLLREKAVTEMTGSVRPDRAACEHALDAAARLCHRLGITSVHTMTRLDDFGAFLPKRQDRRLRVTFCPDIGSLDKLLDVGLKTGFGDEWLRFGGVKIFADGSIGAGNAAVSVPYTQGGLGDLNHADATLRHWVEIADRAGWQTIIHAIGDRAIDQVLTTHDALHTNFDLRHRIEHFELPQLSQLARVKTLGLHLCMQPNFTANWSGPDSMYVDRLGVERDRLSNPLRLIHDHTLPLAFGSDGMPPSPVYGLHGAMHGKYDAQRLTLNEAIRCYTMEGARFAFEEDDKGSLNEGKLADLVALDQDPSIDPVQMSERVVEMTWVGGEPVYTKND